MSWMGGYWSDERPAPVGNPARRLVEVLCCPHCQSLNAKRRAQAGRVVYWTCASCGAGWKEDAKVGKEKVRKA